MTPISRSTRWVALSALSLATCLVPVTVPAATPGSPFATRPHIEVTTSDFVLITPDDEPTARARALQIVRFRRILESLLGVPLRSTLPTTIFALDDVSWTRFAQPRPGMAGYFTAQSFAADLLFDVSVPGRQPMELALHEYTHHLLRTRGARQIPPFFDEGLAELFGTAHASARALRFSLRRDHLALLRGSNWIPFEQLIEVNRKDAHYLDSSLARQFYAQSWATLYHALASSPTDRRLSAFLDALRDGTADPATVTAAAERLVGHGASVANAAISRSVMARDAPLEFMIRLPRDSEPVPMSARVLGADEHDLRLGELLLRLGNRATLARGLFRGVPETSAFAARARVGAALAVLQSGDLQFAAALLDEPELSRNLDTATDVQLGRGLLQLSLSEVEVAGVVQTARLRRLVRARVLFAAALEAPCCWLEATQGYVLATLALRQPEPGLLPRAQRAFEAAPANPDLAAALALVHESEGHAAQATTYWTHAARNLRDGPARSRILQRLRNGASAARSDLD